MKKERRRLGELVGQFPVQRESTLEIGARGDGKDGAREGADDRTVNVPGQDAGNTSELSTTTVNAGWSTA
jgi:hypothetical protein